VRELQLREREVGMRLDERGDRALDLSASFTMTWRRWLSTRPSAARASLMRCLA